VLKNQGGNGGAAGKVALPARGPSSPNETMSAMLALKAATADLLSHLSPIVASWRGRLSAFTVATINSLSRQAP
jgi:hypothetical protein